MRLLRNLLPLIAALALAGGAAPRLFADDSAGAACAGRVAFVLETEGLMGLQAILAEREEQLRRSGYLEPTRPGYRELLRLLLRLAPGWCADLVWPATAEAGAAPGAGHVLLASSPWYELGPRETLSEILVGIGPPTPAPRLADAVAVAAAAGPERPAAVVLVTSAGAEDGSRLEPREAAEVLGGLEVGLAVWQVGPVGGEADGGAAAAPDARWAELAGDGGAAVEIVVIAGWAEVERAVGRLRALAGAAP